jgi:hypothetical protein
MSAVVPAAASTAAPVTASTAPRWRRFAASQRWSLWGWLIVLVAAMLVTLV